MKQIDADYNKVEKNGNEYVLNQLHKLADWVRVNVSPIRSRSPNRLNTEQTKPSNSNVLSSYLDQLKQAAEKNNQLFSRNGLLRGGPKSAFESLTKKLIVFKAPEERSKKEIETKRKLDMKANCFVPTLTEDKLLIEKAIDERKRRQPIKKIITAKVGSNTFNPAMAINFKSVSLTRGRVVKHEN